MQQGGVWVWPQELISPLDIGRDDPMEALAWALGSQLSSWWLSPAETLFPTQSPTPGSPFCPLGSHNEGQGPWLRVCVPTRSRESYLSHSLPCPPSLGQYQAHSRHSINVYMKNFLGSLELQGLFLPTPHTPGQRSSGRVAVGTREGQEGPCFTPAPNLPQQKEHQPLP